jgi:hypothetical protein
MRRICLTSLVDSWARWAGQLLRDDTKPLDAAGHAYTGFSIGIKELRAGIYEVRLADCMKIIIRAATAPGVDSSRFTRQLNEILTAVSQHRLLFERSKNWSTFPGHFGMLLRGSSVSPTVKAECLRILKSTDDVSEEPVDGDDLLSGRVSGWRGTFGFIEHARYPDGVFFPASAVKSLTRRGEDIDLRGRFVKFRAIESGKGRPRAVVVELVGEESQIDGSWMI